MEEAEHLEEKPLAERASVIIPGGTSTGSKRLEALFGDDSPQEMPSHFLSASGCEVTLADGRVITDCTMALGSVAIGYADDVVSHAVNDAVRAGNVSGFAPILEIDLAERMSTLIPIAEKVRFLKTGAEATAAAVRIARAATGRATVLGSGYFGWLDWCSSQKGVPRGVKSDFISIPFNDISALEAQVRSAGNNLAAIILEPMVNELADEAWVRRARELCDAAGAILIFDEIKTGFRLRIAGYQELSGISPDLACYGKAMANGFPLSAVVGRAEIMNEVESNWISSTLACETSALAAAGAVLDWHERAEVCESLWSIGADMRKVVADAIEASGIEGVEVKGIDPMWFIDFDDEWRQNRFTALALERGVLFKRGAYNFASLSHEDEAIENIEHACSHALVDLLDEEQTAGTQAEDAE